MQAVNQDIELKRDVEASVIPVGTKVTLQKGEHAFITQSLGGTYTVVVNGNMFRIEGKDADALGLEAATKTGTPAASGPVTPEKIKRALQDKEKGGVGRYGPGRFPSVPWPEPLKVATPWEGGDGRAANEKPRRRDQVPHQPIAPAVER